MSPALSGLEAGGGQYPFGEAVRLRKRRDSRRALRRCQGSECSWGTSEKGKDSSSLVLVVGLWYVVRATPERA